MTTEENTSNEGNPGRVDPEVTVLLQNIRATQMEHDALLHDLRSQHLKQDVRLEEMGRRVGCLYAWMVLGIILGVIVVLLRLMRM